MAHKQQMWYQKKLLVWSSRLFVLLALLLIAGVIYQSVASANDQATYPQPGKLVEVDGR